MGRTGQIPAITLSRFYVKLRSRCGQTHGDGFKLENHK
jgi:hypothetical protein